MKAKRNRTLFCECGNTKGQNSASCDRCAYLDGLHPVEQDVISSLREGVTLSIRDVLEDVDSPQRSVYRVLQKLERAGRVRGFDEEIEGNGMTGARSRKIYTLTERRAA